MKFVQTMLTTESVCRVRMDMLIRRVLGYVHTAHGILFDRVVELLARYPWELGLNLHGRLSPLA